MPQISSFPTLSAINPATDITYVQRNTGTTIAATGSLYYADYQLPASALPGASVPPGVLFGNPGTVAAPGASVFIGAGLALASGTLTSNGTAAVVVSPSSLLGNPGTTTATAQSLALSGRILINGGTVDLAASGVAAGRVPAPIVDAYGRVVSAGALATSDISGFAAAVSGIAPVAGVSSDFALSSGTLAAATTLARTAATLPATLTSGTYQVTGSVAFNSIARSMGTIAAAGSTQATAAVTIAQDTIVTSGTGGVVLCFFGAGAEQTIRNRTTNTIEVYPQLGAGAQIEGAGINVAVTLGAGQDGRYCPLSATQWYF